MVASHPWSVRRQTVSSENVSSSPGTTGTMVSGLSLNAVKPPKIGPKGDEFESSLRAGNTPVTTRPSASGT